MTQLNFGSASKPSVKVVDYRSYSQNRTSAPINNTNSHIQNAEEITNSKHVREAQNQKVGQLLTPSYKPQPSIQSIEQSYKQKMEDLQNRLGEENKYLRQTTESALKKLENANLAINRIKKEKQDVQKENIRLINELQRKNSSAKEFTQITDKLRKENAALNMKITDISKTINELRSREHLLKQELNRGYSERQLKDRVQQLNTSTRLNKSKDMNEARIYSRESSRQKPSSHLLPPPDSIKPSRQNFIVSQKHSIDKISAISRENSLNNSKRSSNSKYNFIDGDISPKESARMEILFEQIGIIRKNLAVGGKMTQSIASKLFSLINHLTNALNKRNDQNVELKRKLKQYEQMIIDNHLYKATNEINFTFDSQQPSPINKCNPNNDKLKSDRYSTRSIGRPRSSFENYATVPPSRNQSFQLFKPNTFKPDHTQSQSRNQSFELNKNKYNFVYRKISLQQYLKSKIQLVTSMQLVTKITQIVEKNLMTNPKILSVSDFYVLYCEGQCPNNLKTRVQLKHSKDVILPVSELKMMESLGCIFEMILKAIKLTTFEEEKLFDKSVKGVFGSIIGGLKAEEKDRLNMERFKLLLGRLKY